VSAALAAFTQLLDCSPAPTRGVTKVTLRAKPRRVSEMPSSALAANAAVTPGTTSTWTR
jgi:hypothetical protein